MTTRSEIAAWFVEGQAQKAAYMLVVCDTFDYEDYPVFCKTREEAQQKVNDLRNSDNMFKSMQRLMEVYDLSKSMEEQLTQERAMAL